MSLPNVYRWLRVVLGLVLLITLLPVLPVAAATHTSTELFGRSPDSVNTIIDARVCGQGAESYFSSEYVGPDSVTYFGEWWKGPVNGCGSYWQVVINADVGTVFRIYSLVADRQIPDADGEPNAEARRRARVDECTVTAVGEISCAQVARSAVEITIDTPDAGALVGGVFTLAGSAVDLNSSSGPGIAAVRVSASGAAGAVDLGYATYGLPRSDVADRYGDSRFTNAGFQLSIDTARLSGGAMTLRVEAQSNTTGLWGAINRPIQVEYSPPRPAAIDPASAVINAGVIPLVISGADLQGVTSARLIDQDAPGNPTIPLTITTVAGDAVHTLLPANSLIEGKRYAVEVGTRLNGARLPLAFTADPFREPKLVRAMVILACDDAVNGESALEEACKEVFKQLVEAVDRNDNLYVLVLWDGPKDGDSLYYELKPGEDDHQPVQGHPRTSEVDTGSERDIAAFIAWAASQYPGDYKFLSLMGHGGGWAPRYRPPTPSSSNPPIAADNIAGMLLDRNPVNSLGTRELGALIRQVNAGEAAIDLVYLDSCLMGATEVMAEIGDAARFTVSSENMTWSYRNYDTILAALEEVTSAADLAEDVVGAISATWMPGDPMQLGAVDMALMPDLLRAVDGLAAALLDHLTTDRPLIEAARREAMPLNDSYTLTADWALDEADATVDLYELADQLIRQPGINPAIVTAAQQVQTVFGANLVPHNPTKPGRPKSGEAPWEMDRLHGLSIYFPLSDQDWRIKYYEGDPTKGQYQALPQFMDTTRWDEFIQRWHPNATQDDPDECVACGSSPARINLNILAPATINVATVDDVVFIPVELSGITPRDNLGGMRFTLSVDTPDLLVPAGQIAPRYGPLLPGGAMVQIRPTASGWALTANLRSGTQPPRAGGVIVELPFRVRGTGTAQFQLSGRQLSSRTLNALYHGAAPATVGLSAQRVAWASGRIRREWAALAPDLTLYLVRGSGDYTTTIRLTPSGEFRVALRPGSTTLRVGYPNHLLAERRLRAEDGRTYDLGTIILAAGDLNQSGRISTSDWRRCVAALAPVNDRSVDLNADGRVDIRDCQAVANNYGRSAPLLANPPLLSLAALADRAAQRTARSAATIAACATDRADLAICLGATPGPIYGFGVRLQLAEDAPTPQISWSPALDGYEKQTIRDGADLWLIATIGDQPAPPLAESGELLWIAGAGATPAVAGATLVDSFGWSDQLHLPLVTR